MSYRTIKRAKVAQNSVKVAKWKESHRRWQYGRKASKGGTMEEKSAKVARVLNYNKHH